MRTLPNIHPGEVLLEELLTPMSMSQGRWFYLYLILDL